MLWLFVPLAVLTTFVIAAVTVGSVTGRQAARVRRAVYDLDAAVDFVADRLPAEVTAEVSYDDVRAVLEWQIADLQAQGLATYRTDDDATSELVVVSETDALAGAIGRIAELPDGAPASALTDEQVALILAGEEDYRRSIGGFGPAVVS